MGPAGVTVRALESADVEAVVEVANAIAAFDRSGEYVSMEDIVAALAAATDTLGLWSEGRLVGYGWVDSPEVLGELSINQPKGGIHPEYRRRGFGGALLDWLTRRAVELREPGLKAAIDVEIQSINAGGLALVVAHGYQPTRYFSVMQRPYAEPIPAAPVPDGFTLRAFDPAYDEPLRLAHNEIFEDHWGTAPKDEAAWKTWFTGHRAFRPALSRLVFDGERIAAYTLAYEFLPDTEATGVRELWVGQVGTRREYRGLGLARAALAGVLRSGEAAGFERSGLGVDSDSPTGAAHLYEQLGYRVVTTKILHRLIVEAA